MRALVQMLGADSAVASCASDAEKIISPAPTYPFLLALRAQSKPLLVITSSSRAAEDLANELRELHLLHVLSEHFMGRPVRLRGLGRGGELFVNRLDDFAADELTADPLSFRGTLTRRPHREVVCGGEVEADGRAVSEERHDGGGRFERRADHRERTLRGRLDSLQEPAAREIVAVIQTQGMWLHSGGENSSLRP